MKTLKIGITALALFTSLSLGNLGLDHLGIQPVKPKPKPVPVAKIPKADIYCLAKNIYYEARGEPLEGQIAVAQVTLNRVASKQFHSTVCGVVYAHKQFSWTLDKGRKIRDRKAWSDAVDLAAAVLTKSIPLPHFPALYFHTPQVNPRWNRGKRVVARIGNHIFYS
jgi:N-acetylmuramoyl-L-alanine amidase